MKFLALNARGESLDRPVLRCVIDFAELTPEGLRLCAPCGDYPGDCEAEVPSGVVRWRCFRVLVDVPPPFARVALLRHSNSTVLLAAFYDEAIAAPGEARRRLEAWVSGAAHAGTVPIHDEVQAALLAGVARHFPEPMHMPPSATRARAPAPPPEGSPRTGIEWCEDIPVGPFRVR